MKARRIAGLLFGFSVFAVLCIIFVWQLIAFLRPRTSLTAFSEPAIASDLPASRIPNPGPADYLPAGIVPLDLSVPPDCFALSPSGSIWVGAGENITELSRQGVELKSVSLGKEVTALSFDSNGEMYLAAGNHVEVRDPSGGLLRRFADLDERALIVSIASDKSMDDLFLADAGSKAILHLTKKGRLLGRIGGGFVVPSPYFPIAVSADHRLYAANPGKLGIETYGYDGTLLGSFYPAAGTPGGFAGCCNPASIALTDYPSIVTVEKGVRAVKVFSTSGEFRGAIMDEESLSASPIGPEVAAEGRVYVLDRAAKRILVFARRGS
jgi:hypothetical protein